MKESTGTNQAFILAVTSGKGGVGKTISSVNIAELLQNAGFKVALIDADAGLSNCATLLNESVNATITKWINGECYLEDLAHEFEAFTLVTAADNPDFNNHPTDHFLNALDQVTRHLSTSYDFIIIDTPAGAGEITLWALDRADLGAVILVDEPTAISDVYRLCKYVYSIDPGYPFASIVNFAKCEETAHSIHKRFNHILGYFLHKKAAYFGFIPESDGLRQSVKQQQTLLQQNDSHTINPLVRICKNIIGYSESRNKLIESNINY